MKNNRIDQDDFRGVAEEIGVSPEDVKNVVNSFFGVIASEARSLPFDTPRKIYSKSAFNKFASPRIHNIPYIGRIGPIYSRYIKWRVNEAKDIEMVPRPRSSKRLLPEEIEAIAEVVLNGGTYTAKKKENKFKRVWLVNDNGKKSARQVIPKTEKDV